jgi:hypothetical protein
MRKYIVTITERDGRKWTIPAINTDVVAACQVVIQYLQRTVGIEGKPV